MQRAKSGHTENVLGFVIMIIVLRVISVFRSFRPEDKILRICNLVISKEIPLTNKNSSLGIKCS